MRFVTREYRKKRMADWLAVTQNLRGFLWNERTEDLQRLIHVKGAPPTTEQLADVVTDTTDALDDYLYNWIMATALEMRDDAAVSPYDLDSPFHLDHPLAKQRWTMFWRTFRTDMGAVVWHLRALLSSVLFRQDHETNGREITNLLEKLFVFVMARTFRPVDTEELLRKAPADTPLYDVVSEREPRKYATLEEASRHLQYYLVSVNTNIGLPTPMYLGMPHHIGLFLSSCAMTIRMPELFRQRIRSMLKSDFSFLERFVDQFDRQCDRVRRDEISTDDMAQEMRRELHAFVHADDRAAWKDLVEMAHHTVPILGTVHNVLTHEMGCRLPLPWGFLLARAHQHKSAFPRNIADTTQDEEAEEEEEGRPNGTSTAAAAPSVTTVEKEPAKESAAELILTRALAYYQHKPMQTNDV